MRVIVYIFITHFLIFLQSQKHRGGRPLFLHSKKKIGRQRGKGKGFKAETIKRLSPRSKYYCFSHSRVSNYQIFFLSANHGGRQSTALFSIPLHPPHPAPLYYFEIHFAGLVVTVRSRSFSTIF